METKAKQIFLWFGENDFEIHQKLNFWREEFQKKHTSLNVFYFDSANLVSKDKISAEIKNALQVNSLFGMSKLIVFRDFLIAKNKISADINELIADSLIKLSPSFFIIFYQSEKPDAKSKIYFELKKLEKEGLAEIKEFKLPKADTLTKWILTRAKKRAANFSGEAMELLSAIVPNDLWQLDQEIQKLANFKKKEVITSEDVGLMVKGKYNDDIFQLMDAISAKNKKKALRLFQDQLDSGAAELYLFTMLVRQFRIFYQIKEKTKDRSLNSDELAKELGLHPYVVKKSLQYLKNFSLEQIISIYRRLLDFEVKIKTTNVGFEVLFDLLIAEL